MDIQNLLSIAATALACFFGLKGYFVSQDNAKRDRDIALLQKQMDLFWRMVEQHMTTVLHSPHTPDRDKLLEKMQAGEALTDEELDDLADDLEGVINSSSELQGNRATAVFLLAAVERYRQRIGEFAVLKDPTPPKGE